MEVDKSKVSEKLLDAQHEILHLKSSLEVKRPCRVLYPFQARSAHMLHHALLSVLIVQSIQCAVRSAGAIQYYAAAQ